MSVEMLKKDFFNEMKFIKRMGGTLFLRPFANKSRLQSFCFYFILILVLFTSIQLLFTLCLIELSDWIEIINIAPNIGACIMSIIKYFTINYNFDFYHKIYKHFYNDVWEYITDDSPENIKIYKKYLKVTQIINKFLVVFSGALIILVDSFPWLLMTYETQIIGKDSPYLYPFDAWYPFDKVKWYSVAYIWESLMTAIVIALYAFANLVHLSYVAFICMELRLLGNWLQNFINKSDIRNIMHGKNLNDTHKKIKNDLKFIIKRYEFLNELTTDLDKVLGNAMLLAYVFDAVFICLTAFSFTVVDDLFKSLRYFSFFVSLLCELFNQCIIGQVLLDHSASLTEKIYCSDWIYADAETKKILLMLIMRTQTPFKLTAKGFVIMNLSTFSQICSSSYQLFNLLRTLYEKN